MIQAMSAHLFVLFNGHQSLNAQEVKVIYRR